MTHSTEAEAVIACLALTGYPAPAPAALTPGEHGTRVDFGQRAPLVSGPFDPSATGLLRLRAVYPHANLRLLTSPPPLVAEIPGAGFAALYDPVGFAEFGGWAADRPALVLPLLELLAKCQGPAPLTWLIRDGDELKPQLTDADLAAAGPLRPPRIDRSPTGWHAAFDSYSQLVPPDAARFTTLSTWTCDHVQGRPLQWQRHDLTEQYKLGRHRPGP